MPVATLVVRVTLVARVTLVVTLVAGIIGEMRREGRVAVGHRSRVLTAGTFTNEEALEEAASISLLLEQTRLLLSHDSVGSRLLLEQARLLLGHDSVGSRLLLQEDSDPSRRMCAFEVGSRGGLYARLYARCP